ncbi:hypothetical protein EH220_05925 [bacterium]|nr:MAG: hypothetical protein EH220_05925 [bacterium]
MNSTSRTGTFFTLLKWTARTIATLVALLSLFLIFAYTFGESEDSPPDLPASILFALWIIGTIVAWKWPGIGGAIIILGTAAAFFVNSKAVWPPTPLTLFPLAGILFIVYCILKPKAT